MIRRILSTPLWIQIFIALALAFVVGQLTGPDSAAFGVKWVEVFGFIGTLFLRALKMIIVPLIASAVITAVGGLGRNNAFGRLGLKTLGYYFSTSLIAIVIGLFMVNMIRPGVGTDGEPLRFGTLSEKVQSEEASKAAESINAKVGGRGMGEVVGVFLRMLPENVFEAATQNGSLLSVITFSLLFGYFMPMVKGEAGEALKGFWQGVYEVMLHITELIMKFAPLGVFGLVAKVSATTNPTEFLELLWYFFTVLAALGAHFFIALPLILYFVGGVNPLRHYQAMMPVLVTAFSTSSSSATLPVTLESLQKRAGVSRQTSSFIAPLGATVNMDGTALYECVVAMFLAQVYGIEISLTTQFTVVLLALLTSIGVAGVPSASLVAIVIILSAIGIPTEYLGLIMVFDRILDMLRTAVNVFSDTCGAVVLAKSEGEKVLESAD